jgi:hypothetical protein
MTMNLKDITIRDYLNDKGIPFREAHGELITKCLFSSCDEDSRGNEAHLYFNAETGQYDCKKCGAKGNLLTLAKYLGDTMDAPKQPRAKFNTSLVETCHTALPEHIRKYLNARGISDAVIDQHKLGYGQFYRKQWITIPIKDVYGNYSFFKLRQDPDHGNEKITYPKGIEAQIYDWETLLSATDRLVICEGELDRLALVSQGISAITNTHGAGTFKDEWAQKLIKNQEIKEVYFCFDRDEAGRKGAERAAKMVENGGNAAVHIINLPSDVGDGGDLTDYLVKFGGSVEDLFSKYAKPYPERIDTAQFSELTPDLLIETLGLTIKFDAENKLTTFLCELTAYTESAQFNISYNAPSSTGKSYIPTEIARLFPEEDVMEIAYCSPTAFFHDTGEYNKEKNQYLVDLSHKVLIFLDQPHNDLLARLRPLLSHDKKEIMLKITDKSQKAGMRTKNVLLRGYPAVIFCTAGLHIDEQEATRFLLLSPEVSQQKIREGITATIRKESDSDAFKDWLNENPERALLKERVRAIKLENIMEINIADAARITEKFLGDNKTLKPRHQRDIKRLLALVKAFALLNVWWRNRSGSVITANDGDIDAAFALWDKISVSQELNLPPYIYNLYTEVILVVWKEKNDTAGDLSKEYFDVLGVTRQDVLTKHYEVYGRMLDNTQLRQQILPMLETAGLITQEQDPSDKRKILIYPSIALQSSHTAFEEHSDTQGGVEYEEIINEEEFPDPFVEPLTDKQ